MCLFLFNFRFLEYCLGPLPEDSWEKWHHGCKIDLQYKKSEATKRATLMVNLKSSPGRLLTQTLSGLST